jgi:hypothetical protein
MTDKEKLEMLIEAIDYSFLNIKGEYDKSLSYPVIDKVRFIKKSMQEEPTTSVWHDASETPVASKTKIVLYTNGKWDMFKAYEAKDNYDNYWAGVNQALEEKGVLVKKWAYVDELLNF